MNANQHNEQCRNKHREGTMATATWIKHELDGRGLDYEELHHEDAFTAQALAQQEHVSGHQVAKVVLVLAD